MNLTAQPKKENKGYLPHELTTKINSVELYRQTQDSADITSPKKSRMRWNRQYGGAKKSLVPKSLRPHNQHPNAHTEEELSQIRSDHRRNPGVCLTKEEAPSE